MAAVIGRQSRPLRRHRIDLAADGLIKCGYWLAIHRKSGRIENLGRTLTEDGLLCAGYDPVRKLMYGHTNVKGLLTCFDERTREERIIGFPHEGSPYPWPRGLTLMITKDGRIYGGRPPKCSFWEYDPATGMLRTFTVKQPIPMEIAAGGTKKMREQWDKSSIHLSHWSEDDGCFCVVRSFDEMLMRFTPPARAGGEARLEARGRLRPDGLEMRYELRAVSCTLVLHGRTVWYTPNTAWGGVTHLVSFDVDKRTLSHHGPIVVEGRRRVNEVHSMSVGRDGALYMVAFVFSVEGVDPVRPWAMRDKYPFHPRFVIIEPSQAFRTPPSRPVAPAVKPGGMSAHVYGRWVAEPLPDRPGARHCGYALRPCCVRRCPPRTASRPLRVADRHSRSGRGCAVPAPCWGNE